MVNIKFGAQDVGLAPTLKKIDSSMGGIRKETKRVEGQVKLSFAAMAKAGAAFAIGLGAVKAAFATVRNTVSSFKDALDMGSRLSDLKQQTGVAAGELLVLERAFQNSGVGADKVGASINKMQKSITDAGAGLTTPLRAFERMKIKLEDIQKLTPEKQFEAIGKAIMGIQDPTARAATAMDIFGRSGGKMLALFSNFSGEMDEARAQLGMLPAIMSKLSERFDGISDKIAVIRGKFVEFAAGALSKVVPLLELIAHHLSRIDAAAIGMRLAEVFVGAGEAMKGFEASLNAIKLGEFGLSMKALWASIKLQIAETANSIYANFKGAVAAIGTFFANALGPNSEMRMAIDFFAEYLSQRIASGVANALIPIMKSIPGIGEAIAENLKTSAQIADLYAESAAMLMAYQLKRVPEDFAEAAVKSGAAFKSAFEGAGEIIPTGNLRKELAGIEKEINSKIKEPVEEAKNALDGFAESLKLDMPEGAIVDMSKAEAESQKIEKNFRSVSSSAKEVVEALTLSEQISKRIAEAQGKRKADPGGRMERRANEAIAAGRFKLAERAAERIAARQEDIDIQEAFGGDRKAGQSLKDIAREQGIDTFRKSNAELRKALAEKARMKKADEAAAPDAKAADGKPGAERKPKEDAMQKLVGEIKAILEKIEPKLPTHALGV